MKQHLTEEGRDDLVVEIVDGIIAQMSLEDMRQMCWNVTYDDVIWQEWPDLLMLAEEYCPEFLEG